MSQRPGDRNEPNPPQVDPDGPTTIVPKQPPTGPAWGGPPPPPSPPQRPQSPTTGESAPGWNTAPPPPPPPPGYQPWAGQPPQYPQQPYPGGAQYPPAPPRKKRRVPLIVGAVVVVILLVGGLAVAATRFLGGGSGGGLTPTETVQAYLDALASGDAEKALSFGKTQPASTDLLSADILKKQIEEAPITDIRILSNDNALENVGMATVQVAANFGDSVSDAQLRLSKVDEVWKLESATVKIDPPTTVGGDDDANKTLTVFGKPIEQNAIYVFPGYLDVASSNEYLDVTADPVLLDRLYLGSGFLQPKFTLNDEGKDAIDTAIKDAYAACQRSSLISPPGCPASLRTGDAVEGTVRWGRADLTDVKVGNLDPYRLKVSINGEVTIPVDYQARLSGKTGTVTNYLYADADLTRTPLVVDFN